MSTTTSPAAARCLPPGARRLETEELKTRTTGPAGASPRSGWPGGDRCSTPHRGGPDRHRAAGRSGVGAVDGRQNLKAMAIARHQGCRQSARLPGATVDVYQKGARRERVTSASLPPTAPGADERDQRDGRAADPQPPRCAVRGDASRTPPRPCHAARQRRQAPWSPTRPASAARSPGASARDRQTPFHGQNKPQYWGASAALGTTGKPPGRRGGQRRQRFWRRCSMPTCCATSRAWTRSRSAPPSARGDGTLELGVISRSRIGLEVVRFCPRPVRAGAELTARGEGFGREIALGSKRLCENTATLSCR